MLTISIVIEIKITVKKLLHQFRIVRGLEVRLRSSLLRMRIMRSYAVTPSMGCVRNILLKLRRSKSIGNLLRTAQVFTY
jgi:hypothetical protein